METYSKSMFRAVCLKGRNSSNEAYVTETMFEIRHPPKYYPQQQRS